MTDASVETLKSLATAAIDARNGYEEAFDDAGPRGLAGLFTTMIETHALNARELSLELQDRGVRPDESGSFMTTVHTTIMKVRSLFGGLDDLVLPGLIDGEKRNIAKYEEALRSASADSKLKAILTPQVERLRRQLAGMEAANASRIARNRATAS